MYNIKRDSQVPLQGELKLALSCRRLLQRDNESNPVIGYYNQKTRSVQKIFFDY
jgi:hypothetical protein